MLTNKMMRQTNERARFTKVRNWHVLIVSIILSVLTYIWPTQKAHTFGMHCMFSSYDTSC